MNRRDHVVVAVLVLVLVGLTGVLALPRAVPVEVGTTPSAEPTLPPPATYREGVVGAPTSITPVTARTRPERTLVGLIFSGLVRLGPGNELEPDLAASWSVNDAGTEWTFRIRDDAAWQDGVPVTAEDVVYTVQALKSPDATGAASSSWAEVEATAVEDRLVRFTLATPIAGFLAAATQPLLPAHLLRDVPFAELASDPFSRQPVGTGAFALETLDATRAVLTPTALLDAPQPPDPDASADSLATQAPVATPAGPVPYLERIEIRFYDDPGALADAVRTHEVDAAAGLPPEEAVAVADAPGIERLRYPTTTLSTVLLDLRPAHPELRDPRVRRALLSVIDRNELVDTLLAGDGLRADALVPPGSWAYDATAAAPITFDPKRAAALLTEAGWKESAGAWIAPKGKAPFRIELLGVPGTVNPRLAAIAAYVRDAWRSLGFEVDLVEVPVAELASRLRAGRFTAAVVDIAMGLEPDLFPLLASSQVRASGSNLAGYQDAALDPLLAAARAPGTPETRTAAWKALLAGLATRMPMLPLAWSDEVVFERGLEGASPRLIAEPGDRFWDVLAWRLAADR
jgi:peptide/nickel transport system substrate-binding protein